MSVHPQAIDLSQIDAPTTGTSERLPLSTTLLVCATTIIPTLWMAAVVALVLAHRF